MPRALSLFNSCALCVSQLFVTYLTFVVLFLRYRHHLASNNNNNNANTK